MEVIKFTSAHAEVQLSIQELNTFINSLNEVYSGIYVAEFNTRMGISREEAKAFSESLLQIREKVKLDNEFLS